MLIINTLILLKEFCTSYPAFSCQNKMGLLLPRDSVEISFDVSGFNYDNPDAVETPAPTKEAKKTDSKKSGSTNYAAVVGGVVVVIIVIAGVVVAVRCRKMIT